ncbi:MAG TPA: glycosyltransferase family 2 protein, partial [Actinomycetota bacterium]
MAVAVPTPDDGRPEAELELDVTVVIPCLDEEETIERCVREARAAIERQRMRGEVLVVDNGSRDRSAELAAAAGAIVVHEDRRGYGRAYLTGLEHARGRFILLGDGDATYDFDELPRFVSAMDEGADMVLGSRIRGRILPGAMPWHHRWIGNPALTGLLNLIYRTGVSDAHCGLRMVRRSALPRLGLRSTGMEFASEMVVKAKLAGLRIAERPITYAARPGGSRSKLRSLHDGLRHVLYLLAWAPARVLMVPAAAMLAAAG